MARSRDACTVRVLWTRSGDVVRGTAYLDGRSLVSVASVLASDESPASLIDRELSRALDALLDEVVGPLRWKQVADAA